MESYTVIDKQDPLPAPADWTVGRFVTSRFEMTDYAGQPFHVGEVGIIVRATRSTIHVRDPRGYVHRGRYRNSFNLNPEAPHE